MLKTVLFCDRPTAERNAGQPDWAIISIAGISMKADLRDGWLDVLRLEFADTENVDDPFGFNPLQAMQIDDFVEQAAGRGAIGILVHCHAGISRSAAVAKWIAFRYELPFNHKYELFNRLVFQMLRDYQDRRLNDESPA